MGLNRIRPVVAAHDHACPKRYAATMCAGCVMAATAGASGARAWLQAQHLTWLTPRRMRAVTVSLLVAAFAISSVGISGSTPPPRAAHRAAAIR
jgi:hypothetical protein